MSFSLTITNAGRAAIVNAAKDGTNAVRVASVGVSATTLAATPATAALPGEIKRITTISGDATAADTIHVTVRDESNAAYAVRSIALYLADGTLFAAYGQSDVLVEKSSQALLLLALDVRFADIAAANLTFGNTNFLNPPATTEREGVVELATIAEAQAGIDALRALTPQGAKAAIMGWLASFDGAGSGLDADLLDGQEGSYYTNIKARLGYTPLNRAGDTSTGRQVFAAGATGNNGLINAPVSTSAEIEIRGNGTGGAFAAFNRPGAFAALLGLDVDNVWKVGGGSAGLGANPLWHAGNDGSGSGLDADLLDGQQAEDFAKLAGATFSGDVRILSSLFFGGSGGVRIGSPTANRLGLFSGDDFNERLSITPSGYVSIGGQRNVGTVADVIGSGNFRVIAHAAGGTCYTAFDTQNYTAHQFVRQYQGAYNQIGSITCSETATSYNTASDYRLKEDWKPIADPIGQLRRLKPYNYRWRSTGLRSDGFLAHDLAEVKPDAVTGKKDAMRLQTVIDRPATPATYDPTTGKIVTPEVPEVSHEEKVPDYQSVDLSKLVPLLTASVQRLADEVDLLKAQLQGANDNG
nr:tail fiber domain-containing protein [uncultured Sphingomonas sp.]